MSTFPGPWNPITYAQFHVGGGWRTAAAVVGGYALLGGGAVWLTAATDRHPAQVLEGWAHGLLPIQMLILFAYGTYRVNAAVRGDVAGHMIESHRLMPMSPLSAVLGYVVGTPVVPVLLFAVTVGLGSVCIIGSGGLGGLTLDGWVVANGMIAATGVMAWAVVAQFAFAARGGFVILLVAAALALVSQGELVLAVPALNLMTAPLLGRSVVLLRRMTGDSSAFGASLAVQAAVTGICLRAAVRRYRSPAAAGFSPLLGLMLVATWAAASVVALGWPDLSAGILYWRRPSVEAGFTTSVACGLLLAAIPVASAARRAADVGSIARRVGPLVWAVPVAAALVTAVAFTPALEQTFTPYATTPPADAYRMIAVPLGLPVVAASTLAWLAGTGGLFAWLSARHRRAWAAVTLWVGFTWIGPVVVDLIFESVSKQSGAGFLTALSPVGAVAMAYDGNPSGLPVGVAGQCLIAAVPIVGAALVVTRTPLSDDAPGGGLGFPVQVDPPPAPVV